MFMWSLAAVIVQVYHAEGHNTVWERSAVAFAGFVGMSFANCLLIIFLGAGRRQDLVRTVAPVDDGVGYGTGYGPGGGGYGTGVGTGTYNNAGVAADRPAGGVTGPGTYGRNTEVV